MATHTFCRCADCREQREAKTCWECQPHRIAKRFFEDYPEWEITVRVPPIFEKRDHNRGDLQGWYGHVRPREEDMWVWLCRECVRKHHAKKLFKKLVATQTNQE